MNPDKQRIAIAEACGHKDLDWRIIAEGTGLDCLDLCSGVVGHGGYTVPDYLNDLNAMHGAEKVLKPAKRHYYMCELERVLGFQTGPGGWDMDEESMWAMVHATAAQRAEAFLRVLKLWEDNQ